MIKSMNHVGISVADLERSIKFYRDAFRLEVVSRSEFGDEMLDKYGERYERKYRMVLGLESATGKVATLRSGTLTLELFEFKTPEPKTADPHHPVCDHGISHFCVEVADLPGEYLRLQSAGATFHCPPQIFFGGKALATYGRDPDGNVFELLELID